MEMGILETTAGRPSARAKWTPHNDFQRWAYRKMSQKGLRPLDVHRFALQAGLSVTESYIYRILRQAHRSGDRPGYDLVYCIGEMLDDVRGALESAGYRVPSVDAPVPLDEAELINLYRSAAPGEKERTLAIIRELLSPRYTVKG